MRDVLVIGGGIIGRFIALECQARGMTVTLIDAGQSRPSASWAGGGILSPLFPWRYHASWRPLVSDSLDRYGQWREVLRSETGLFPEINACGMLVRESEVEQARRWARDERVKLLPARESGISGGFSEKAELWMPDIAAVRNSRWLSALEVLCEHRGIRRVLSSVSDVVESAGAVEVCAGEERFRAGQAVVAAGYWSKALLKGLPFTEELMPVKGEMLLYQLEPGEIPAILLADSGYLIPRKDGLVLAGSTLNAGVQDMRPGAAAHQVLRESAADWYPPLAKLQPVAHWAGVRPGNRRPQPIIGPIHQGSRICVATGHFRNGLVSAPATGQLVAEMVSGQPPFCESQPYSPSS